MLFRASIGKNKVKILSCVKLVRKISGYAHLDLRQRNLVKEEK